nr:YbfB/YjiJ family MFS transporter [Microbispora rosea]
MLLTAAALAATAVSSAYSALLTARAAAGVGGALVFVAGGVIASRNAAAAGSPAPITIYFSGAGLGIAVSGAWLPSLVTHAPQDWPAAWAGLAVCALIATVVSWPAARAGEPERTSAAGRRQMLRLWRTGVAYLLFAGGYIAYITFLPAALAGEHTLVWQVSTLWILLGISATAAPRVWDRVIGAWPPARVLTIVLALLAGASALGLAGSSYVVLAGSVVAYGGTFMIVPAVVTATIRGATRPETGLPRSPRSPRSSPSARPSARGRPESSPTTPRLTPRSSGRPYCAPPPHLSPRPRSRRAPWQAIPRSAEARAGRPRNRGRASWARAAGLVWRAAVQELVPMTSSRYVRRPKSANCRCSLISRRCRTGALPAGTPHTWVSMRNPPLKSKSPRRARHHPRVRGEYSIF